MQQWGLVWLLALQDMGRKTLASKDPPQACVVLLQLLVRLKPTRQTCWRCPLPRSGESPRLTSKVTIRPNRDAANFCFGCSLQKRAEVNFLLPPQQIATALDSQCGLTAAESANALAEWAR